MPEPVAISGISGNVITTSSAHGFTTQNIVGVSGTSLPTELDAGRAYFARVITSTTLTLHATKENAQNNASIISITNTSGAGRYIEKLTVREGIERDLVRVLKAITSIGTVERWDARGNTRSNLSLVVKPDDEEVFAKVENVLGATGKALLVELDLMIVQDGDGTKTTSEIASDWLGRIETAVLADEKYLGVAQFTDVVSINAPDSFTDQPEASVGLGIRIQYRHVKGDPYSPI